MAEIPNEQTDPVAFQIVMRCIITGHIGKASPNLAYMVNGECSKHYPKSTCNEEKTK